MTRVEYDKQFPDSMQAFLAAARFSQVIAKDVIEKTLQHNQEQQQIARSTDFEKNFSRINLLA